MMTIQPRAADRSLAHIQHESFVLEEGVQSTSLLHMQSPRQQILNSFTHNHNKLHATPQKHVSRSAA